MEDLKKLLLETRQEHRSLISEIHDICIDSGVSVVAPHSRGSADSKPNYEPPLKRDVKKHQTMPLSDDNVLVSRDRLEKLQKELLELRACVGSMRDEMENTRRVGITLRHVTVAFNEVTNLNAQLVEKYKSEHQKRVLMHDKVMELRGNIRVFCRVRPFLDNERSPGQAQASVTANNEEDVVQVMYEPKTVFKRFEYDRVFGSSSSQQELGAELEPLTLSVMDGYNVCIFAYGQTGSGKTYTMEGPPENRGINYQAFKNIFKKAKHDKEHDYKMTVTLLEIYNDNIRDLLSKGEAKKLDIRQGVDGVHIPGLTPVPVRSVAEAWKVLERGNSNRATGATNLNQHSSRSHLLLNMEVIGFNNTTGVTTKGRLHLIDLAGSERVSRSAAQGERLVETRHINKSLSALGNVMSALLTKKAHVPYRDSKLTYFLQDSLGGNAKTLMFVHASPAESDIGETLCTLNFASRVRNVESGTAKQNVSAAPSEMDSKGEDAVVVRKEDQENFEPMPVVHHEDTKERHEKTTMKSRPRTAPPTKREEMPKAYTTLLSQRRRAGQS